MPKNYDHHWTKGREKQGIPLDIPTEAQRRKIHLMKKRKQKPKGTTEPLWMPSKKNPRGPVVETAVGQAGLRELPGSMWADRDNPPWTGPSDWPWWKDQCNMPEDFLDPRIDL